MKLSLALSAAILFATAPSLTAARPLDALTTLDDKRHTLRPTTASPAGQHQPTGTATASALLARDSPTDPLWDHRDPGRYDAHPIPIKPNDWNVCEQRRHHGRDVAALNGTSLQGELQVSELMSFAATTSVANFDKPNNKVDGWRPVRITVNGFRGSFLIEYIPYVADEDFGQLFMRVHLCNCGFEFHDVQYNYTPQKGYNMHFVTSYDPLFRQRPCLEKEFARIFDLDLEKGEILWVVV